MLGGRTSGLHYICGKMNFSRILLMIGFLIFGVIGRTRLSSNLGRFVLVGRVDFSLKISKFDKVTNHKFVSHVY
jgi:hypothetical protein